MSITKLTNLDVIKKKKNTFFQRIFMNNGPTE